MKEKEGISSLRKNRKSDYLTRDGFIYLNGDWLLSTKDIERSKMSQGDSEPYTVEGWRSSEVSMLSVDSCYAKLVGVEASTSS